MASHIIGYQEAEDLPHEMSPRYPGYHFVGQAAEHRYPRGDWRIAN